MSLDAPNSQEERERHAMCVLWRDMRVVWGVRGVRGKQARVFIRASEGRNGQGRQQA